MSSVYNAGLSPVDSYYALQMMPQMRYEGVYQIQPDYTVITQLSEKLSAPRMVERRRFEYSEIEDNNISVEVISRTASGANLVLGFSDTTFNKIRVGELLRSNGSGAIGKVVSKQAGEVTVKPWAGSDGLTATAFVSADFATSTNANVLFNSSKNEFSRGTESLTYMPENDFNYVGVTRDSLALSREAMFTATYERVKGGKYWALGQEDIMMRRFARSLEYKAFISPRVADGESSTPEGLYWHIKRKGTIYPMSTANVTRGILNDFLEQHKRNTGYPIKKMLGLCGLRFLRSFQENVGYEQIVNVGSQNTLGGSGIQGMDVYLWKAMGMEIYLVHYPMLDSQNGPFNEISSITNTYKWSSTCVLLNTEMVETTTGMLSPFEHVYMGPDPILYRYISGMIGPDGSNSSNIITDGKIFTSNDIDGISCEVLTDDGYQWNGGNLHGIIELSS